MGFPIFSSKAVARKKMSLYLMNGKSKGETGYRIAAGYLQGFVAIINYKSIISSFLFLWKALMAKKLQEEGRKQCAEASLNGRFSVVIWFFFL